MKTHGCQQERDLGLSHRLVQTRIKQAEKGAMRLDGARTTKLPWETRFSVVDLDECTIKQVQTRMIIATADTLEESKYGVLETRAMVSAVACFTRRECSVPSPRMSVLDRFVR